MFSACGQDYSFSLQIKSMISVPDLTHSRFTPQVNDFTCNIRIIWINEWDWTKRQCWAFTHLPEIKVAIRYVWPAFLHLDPRTKEEEGGKKSLHHCSRFFARVKQG